MKHYLDVFFAWVVVALMFAIVFGVMVGFYYLEHYRWGGCK